MMPGWGSRVALFFWLVALVGSDPVILDGAKLQKLRAAGDGRAYLVLCHATPFNSKVVSPIMARVRDAMSGTQGSLAATRSPRLRSRFGRRWSIHSQVCGAASGFARPDPDRWCYQASRTC
eukprot:3045437-Rhodomonas_salina.4